MADDLEKAIIQAYDPMISQQNRASALAYLSQVSASSGGWRTFAEKLFATSDVQVALVCLTALGDVVLHWYLALTAEEHVEFKGALFSYMQSIVGPQTPEAIETRLAVVVVYLFKQDFPQEWPGFFSDLAAACLTTPAGLTASKENPMQLEDASSLPSVDGVRMWLRVLHVIHEEVVSVEVNRSVTDAAHGSLLKDAMRDFAIVDLVETWYSLLVCFHESHRDTVNTTLQVMAPYVDWIDIGLIVNDRFLPILFKLATIPDYAAKTIQIFIGLLDKGMDRDPRQKLELMQTLQLPRILAQVQPSDEDGMEMTARLVNSMGVEILECYKFLGDQIAQDAELNKLITELLHCALENLFKYFNDDYDETSRSVMDFAKQYLQFMRKVKKMNGGVLSPDMLEQVKILIQIYHKKMRYDESYDFNDMDGDEDDFEEFRRNLGEQFKTLTKMEPELAYEYVSNLVSQLGALQDPLDMEVIIRCLWLIGEGVSVDAHHPGSPSSHIIEMMRILIDSKIFNYEEPRVLVSQFFECVTRYSKLFSVVPELITPLLHLWMGKHGVLHPHTPTRARRCVGFTQFVKNLKAPLQDYLMDIVQHLQDFATLRPDSFEHISAEEQLELLECFGVLVGFDRADEAKHKNYLDHLIMPLVENLSNIIEQKQYLNDQPHNQYYTNWTNWLIRGIGTFSKGFPLPIVSGPGGIRRPDTAAPATEAMVFFARVFDIVMQTLGVLGTNNVIRSACVFYYQRMAVCLSSSYLLPFLPVITDRLLSPLTVGNMNEYMMLLTKMIGTYGSEIAEVLSSQLSSVVSKVLELLAHGEATVTPQSDEERDLNDLKHNYFALLSVIGTTHLSNVFVSEANFGNLQVILDSVLQGCGALGDPISQKHAFLVLTCMVKEWLGEGQGPNPNLPEGFVDTFVTWLYTHAVPAAFEVPFSVRFNLEDAKSSEALQEMAQFERAVFNAVGASFEQYLTSQLPSTSLQCSPDVVAQYLDGLKSGSTAKQWKKFKSEFILYHRKL